MENMENIENIKNGDINQMPKNTSFLTENTLCQLDDSKETSFMAFIATVGKFLTCRLREHDPESAQDGRLLSEI